MDPSNSIVTPGDRERMISQLTSQLSRYAPYYNQLGSIIQSTELRAYQSSNNLEEYLNQCSQQLQLLKQMVNNSGINQHQPPPPQQQRPTYSMGGPYGQMGMNQTGSGSGGYRNDNLSHRGSMTEFAPLQQQQGMHPSQHLGSSGLSQPNSHNSIPNSIHHMSNNQLNIPSHISSNSGSLHLPHYQTMNLQSNIPHSSSQNHQSPSSINLPHLSHPSNVHSAPISQQHPSSVHQPFSSNTLLPTQGSSQLAGIGSIHHSSSSSGVPSMNQSLIHQNTMHPNQQGQLSSGIHQSLVNPSSINLPPTQSAPVIPNSSQPSSLQSNSSSTITTPALSLPIANSSASLSAGGASDDELYWQKLESMKIQYVRPLTLMIQCVEKTIKGKTTESTIASSPAELPEIRKKLVLLFSLLHSTSTTQQFPKKIEILNAAEKQIVRWIQNWKNSNATDSKEGIALIPPTSSSTPSSSASSGSRTNNAGSSSSQQSSTPNPSNGPINKRAGTSVSSGSFTAGRAEGNTMNGPNKVGGNSIGAPGGGIMNTQQQQQQQQRTNYSTTNNQNQSNSLGGGMMNGNTNYNNFPNLHSTRGNNSVHSLLPSENSSSSNNSGSNDIHSIPPPSSSSNNSSTLPLFNMNLHSSNSVQNQINLHSQNSPPHSIPSRGVNNLPSSNSSVNNPSSQMFNPGNSYLSSRQPPPSSSAVSNPSPSPSNSSSASNHFHPDFLPTPNFSDPLLPINLDTKVYDAIEQMFSSYQPNDENQFGVGVGGIGNEEAEQQNRNYQNSYDDEIFGKKRTREQIDMVFKTEDSNEEYEEFGFSNQRKKQKGNFDETEIFPGEQKGISLQNQELNEVFKIEKEERGGNSSGNGNYGSILGNHNFPGMMGPSSSNNPSDSSASNSRYSYSDLPSNLQQDSISSSFSLPRNDKIQQELNQLSKQFTFRYASRDGDDPCVIECVVTHSNAPAFFIRVPLNYPENFAEIDLPSSEYDWGSTECQMIKKHCLEKGNTNYIQNLLLSFLDALANRHS